MELGATKTILALALGVFLAVLGTPPTHAAPVDGDNEVQISGGFFHEQNSDAGNLNFDVQYGYYLTPGWEIGIRQALNYNFVDDGPDFWRANTTPFIHYNFRVTDIMVPYLGVSGGIAWNDRDVTGLLGPSVGLKLFVHDQTFVNLGYRYEWFFKSFEGALDNKSHGNHVGNIGVGFRVGAGPAAGVVLHKINSSRITAGRGQRCSFQQFEYVLEVFVSQEITYEHLSNVLKHRHPAPTHRL